MQFRVLGPVEARSVQGHLVRLGAAKHRTLLALLLLEANRPVGTDRIVDALWPDAPPRSARGVLRTYASALRSALGLAAYPGEPALVATAGGYKLQVARSEVDALVFLDLAEKGERQISRGELVPGVVRLRSALSLWRGRAAEGVVPHGAMRVAVVNLEERRLAVQELSLRARLALEHDGEILADLRALAEASPLRERFTELLMLALSASGRQAEALEVYGRTRRAVASELGLEPGPALRALHRDILAGRDVRNHPLLHLR